MNINWKQVLIGFIITFILSVVLLIVADATGAYIGYLLGTLYVGYAVGGDYKNAAIHGAITALITGIFGLVSLLLLATITLSLTGKGLIIPYTPTVEMLFEVVINGIIGAIGGALGFLFKGPNN